MAPTINNRDLSANAEQIHSGIDSGIVRPDDGYLGAGLRMSLLIIVRRFREILSRDSKHIRMIKITGSYNNFLGCIVFLCAKLICGMDAKSCLYWFNRDNFLIGINAKLLSSG